MHHFGHIANAGGLVFFFVVIVLIVALVGRGSNKL